MASTDAGGTVQLNVRMSRKLRDAGTAALVSKGLTPSEFVRMLWQKAALRGASLDQVVRAAQETPASISPVIDTVAQDDPVERGQLLYARCLDQLGLDEARLAPGAQASYDDLIADAISSKWQSRGLIDE